MSVPGRGLGVWACGRVHSHHKGSNPTPDLATTPLCSLQGASEEKRGTSPPPGGGHRSRWLPEVTELKRRTSPPPGGGHRSRWLRSQRCAEEMFMWNVVKCSGPVWTRPAAGKTTPSLVVGRWSLVAGRWSLVVGRWSLVVGRWSGFMERLVGMVWKKGAYRVV